MGKPTKRERKFQASGGVKRRLERGGMATKGKPRKRQKKSTAGRTEKSTASEQQPLGNQSRPNDFLGDNNLGDLDIDSFFEKLTDTLPGDVAGDALHKLDKKKSNTADDSENEDSASDSESEDDFMAEDKSGKKGLKQSKNQQSDSSESDDSDDEDLDAAEERMKIEMAKMKEADPEFHEFLKENEESLLEFGDDDDDDDDDMKDDDGDDEGGNDKVHLTASVLASLEKGTFKSHGLKSLKKLVVAYKAACHLSDAADEDKGSSPYIIDSSKIFDELMLLCLNRIHEEFHYHLLRSEQKEETNDIIPAKDDKEATVEDDKPLNPKLLEKAERWPQLRLIIQSFFKSTLHVMSEAKEPDLLVFVLKALAKLNRYLTPFPRLASAMLKSLTALWSAPLDTSEKYQVVRLNAFLRIRQLALTQPFPFIEDILKKTYLAYAKRAKFGTGASVSSVLPTLTFMGNCLCELYSLDHHSSYQHAFVYIRQLALLLRTAMHKKTKEAMQQVYHWQYLHCLKLWVAVLCDSTIEEDSLMRSLIYPLTEVIMGTLRFTPSPTRNLPYRFHCIRLLQQLAAFSQTFIPTSALLLESLDLKEWYLHPKKTKKAENPPQMELILKLGSKEDALRTHEQMQASMNAFFVLLNRDIELYRFSAGFPEYSSRIIQRLRTFSKESSRQPRWRAMAKGCIETCEKYSAFAVQARQKLQESPKDIQQLECLRPTSMKTMRDRHDESVQREQKLLDERMKENRVAEEKKRPTKAEESDEDDDQGDAPTQKPKTKKKQKSKKTKTPQAPIDEKALEEDDAVQEGVDWSDDDSD
jgi:nucleolar complex protein 2